MGSFKSSLNDVSSLLSQAIGAEAKLIGNAIKIGQEEVKCFLTDSENTECKTQECFEIKRIEGSIYIESNSYLGLESGLYYYLKKLGFRFYLPSDNWKYIPSISSIIIDINNLVSPSFASREFFTGFTAFPLGKNDKLINSTKAVSLWQSRNNIRQGLKIERGHSGYKFNKKYANILKAKPSMRPEINGKRVSFKTSIKHSYVEKDVVDLFINDVRQRILDKIKEGEPKPYFINIEPTDGSGFCRSEKSIQDGSISNNIFGLANKVARAIEEDFPNAYICLLAYGKHAPPPTFKLHPKVFVTLTPFGFQEYSDPITFVNHWNKLAARRGVRVYFGSISKFEVPTISYRNEVNDFVNYIHATGYENYVAESSYGFFHGLGQSFVAHKLFDEHLDFDNWIDEFTGLMFEDQKDKMLQFYSLLESNFDISTDLPLGASMIREAYSETTSEKVKSRLVDLKSYLIYLHFLNKNKAPTRTGESTQNWLDYVWSTHNRMMVSSWQITQASLKRYKVQISPTRYDRKNIHFFDQLTNRQVDEIFEKLYNSVEKTAPRMNRLNNVQKGSNEELIVPNKSKYFHFIGNSEFNTNNEFQANLTFDIVIDGKTNSPYCSISVLDENNKTCFYKKFEAKGTYNVSFENFVGTKKIIFNTKRCNVKLFQPNFCLISDQIFGYPGAKKNADLYFIIPAGTQQIQVRSPKSTRTISLYINDVLNEQKSLSNIKEISVFKVDNSSQPRIGSFKSVNSSLELLNIPNSFTLDPKCISSN